MIYLLLIQDSLKHYLQYSIMTSIVQDIQFVRSLRKDNRDVSVTSSILNSIESIHNCIKCGTDLNGWKKIDWRNGSSSRVLGQRNGSSSERNTSTGYNRGGNNFFNGRQIHERSELTSHSSSQYAFGNRNKTGISSRQTSSPPASIPLTHNTTINTSDSPITTQSHTCSDGFRTVSQKYVSKFKKNSDKVEDTILNTILLGKLNKFSELNYAEIKEFVTHIIDGGQTEMIKCFMKLVFEKAASEEMFCPLYAKLLSELSSRYTVLLSEMTNLYSVYIAIFEEVPEAKAENYNEICKQNVEKKYRRGYSQFLAELIKHNVIDTDIFMKTIITILTQVEKNIKNKDSSKLNEEYADCFMKIMKAIQDDAVNDFDDDDDKAIQIQLIRESLKGYLSERIQLLTVRNPDNIGLSNKARFTFLDIYEAIQKIKY